MGKKAKSSRKGKKAWRANISTEDIEDFIEKSTKDALTGGSLADVPTESLFFVDKSKDLSVRRKIEKHREKVLRCDSILEKNPFVQPVSNSQEKIFKKTSKKVEKGSAQDANKDGNVPDSAMVDIWADEGECDKKTRKMSKPSVIPAVEVAPSGCSYNPKFEDHQDALAKAVAQEMQKVYQNELGPQPVPLMVTGKEIDEEDVYFLDVEKDSDDGVNEENLSENEDTAAEKRSNKTKRVTRVELNRRARFKEQQKKEAEVKKKKELSKEIDCLPEIIQEIAKEDEKKLNKRVRRVLAEHERLRTRPPRLGKHKFEPAPSQVLLSEEITGSLRKLKGCSTLARDRFKSLQKRGLIAPTIKSRKK